MNKYEAKWNNCWILSATWISLSLIHCLMTATGAYYFGLHLRVFWVFLFFINITNYRSVGCYTIIRTSLRKTWRSFCIFELLTKAFILSFKNAETWKSRKFASKIFKISALNDVTLRHLAHSIGVDMAVFRFFSRNSAVAMHFPSFSRLTTIVLVHKSFFHIDEGIKVHIKTLHTAKVLVRRRG